MLRASRFLILRLISDEVIAGQAGASSKRVVKCSARSTQQIRHRLTALQAPRNRIRANADNRKASRPSLFECLGPQKTATVLLNNIYRTPVSGIFRGLWRKPGQRFAVCGGIPAWQMNVSRTIAVKNQGAGGGPARPAGGYELARSRPAERPSYRPIRRKPGAISHPFPLRR